MFHSSLEVDEVVLNHVIGVVTEKWFQVQTDNTSMFVKTSFGTDIGSWFRYPHRCVGAFYYDNPLAYFSIVAESLL